jgi:hypothetical protein
MLLPAELKGKLHKAAALYYERQRRILHELQKSGQAATKLGAPETELVQELLRHWLEATRTTESRSRSVLYLAIVVDNEIDTFLPTQAKRRCPQAIEIIAHEETLAPKLAEWKRRIGVCAMLLGDAEEAAREPAIQLAR